MTPAGPSSPPGPEDAPELSIWHRPLEEVLGAGMGELRRRAPLGTWLREGLTRVATSYWTIGQCAIGAMIGWLIADRYVHHGTPVFAPIAAVVCLGLAHAARLRRTVELAAGVSVGVGLADLLVRVIGSGWWQVGLVCALAMIAGQILGGGNLITTQAAVQSIFLVALRPGPGGGLARWEDALIGSATALLVAAALPPNPVRAVRPWAQQLITEVADVVQAAADAVHDSDASAADAALERARRTQVNVQRLSDALAGGEEITRISPLRRRHAAELERYRRAMIGTDLAARNLRVAVRRVATVLERGLPLPPELAGILAQLASVLRDLHDQVGTSAVELPTERSQFRQLSSRADPPDPGTVPARLIALAGRLDPDRLGAGTMSSTVIVAQIRSAVVDLLQITGMDIARARALLPTSTQPGPAVRPDVPGESLPS